MLERLGCLGTLAALGLTAAALYPAGMYAKLCWWFLEGGWNLFTL